MMDGMDYPDIGLYERPWGMWRHLDPMALDREAMRFMTGVRTIAIIPFLDLSDEGNERSPWMIEGAGSRRITEFLGAELMQRGYLVVPTMDTEGALKDIQLDTGIGLYSGTHSNEELAVMNNILYRGRSFAEATRFHVETIPGLADHYRADFPAYQNLTVEEVSELASMLGADAIIRGVITDFQSHRQVDGDLRSIIPPFIGLWAPEQKVKLMVAFYLYDGPSGEMVWNSAVEVKNSSGWAFNPDARTTARSAEKQAVMEVVGRIVPGWDCLIMAHPGWMPHEMWFGEGRRWERRMIDRPDWINPFRRGWHDEYYRGDWRLPGKPYEGDVYRYRGLGPRYNAMMDDTDESSDEPPVRETRRFRMREHRYQ